MKGRSALPRLAFITGLLAVAAAITSPAWARAILTRIDYFDARRVEVTGTYWIAPDAVLRLAAVDLDRSVWDDYGDIESRLVEHPLIAEAQVRRSGLHGLRIVIREVEPIALAGVPDLRPVCADGALLPIDPATGSLDLPLLMEGAQLADDSTRLRDGPALDALKLFGKLRAIDPGLAAVVSDFQLTDAGRDGILINLEASQPVERLALPGKIDETLVRRIRATLADLRVRGSSADMLEARFADQIVVRRETS
ncbi:MAG: FtsQ-type POTRA domain-containing protein [Gemmatimonadetes bacterium]|uniref:FtsQ-type POTRA domain-containing protein n=1 Tax=Candidatus Kutchimonas denitrificans TaxID=3056748 RepID=A0AAE5CAF4_9BACT|nr:FtsQ-type POTRA domain-containing protein [Gemmatimonadota bacterium]NIR74552.1 FtsQ-type POTRA domain-containing protein [Candidatus Kutchimonas denitrificans]NIS02742.1 FtsQ-type POTRA domain-containing protein [Gemmatimonadota bacterium]NIT68903.1 FtsQ-type POTRA domain-containing protein [Gemmatimonadota bacterium]NIU52208.1 FtsQ-type POTRA domain-containing protein [Gemmatimonadota bacterium]